ncbi:putative SOS response-associated peptidase YedK [Methylobacter tundripaludum]|uniref:Abasic site processing protein n=1 Tax=Methylobacter tundripaludum TaxID=173365 RepID=A0A2S6HH22_9GAMM|nr:SOS response-associated peptidase [Methylobacter tundripaludum]PPK76760.1 putative SOS response-associated peptidase YedK [Methylobacter tundripaludum]
MCGRYNLIATGQQIMDHFRLLSLPVHNPDYNIPPGQKILAIVQLEDGSNRAVNLHWGLIPSWSKDRTISSHLINARAETLTEKPSFKKAYQHRRCLIPATGFFEWQSIGAGKQPYHIHKPDNALFAFGGLWEHWEQDQETVYSCTIITTVANDKIAPIHNRMPIIIAPDDYNRWLDKKTAIIPIADFLAADAYRNMQITPISTRVNNPLHNDESCLK